MEQTAAPKPGAKRRRAVGTALFWASVITVPAWAIVRLFGLESSLLAATPATQLMAFTPYAAAFGVVPLLLALGNRRWRTAAVVFTATAALAFCVLPRTSASGIPSAAEHGPGLRVLSANLSLGHADAAAVVRLVRDHKVDVLALQEFTPEVEAAFDRAGIDALLPFHEKHPSALAAGSALFSRFPLGDPGFRKNWGGFYQVHATVHVPGADRAVLIESVHACSPSGLRQLHCWRTDLAREPHADDVSGAAGTVPPALRVLAGDFNATLDHAPLRDLIGHGYRDAADSAGAGWVGTWGPYDRHGFVPPVAIDHVLADTSVGARSFDAYGVKGTDHRAILAVLAVPPGSGRG